MLLVFEVAFFATTYYLLYYLLIQFQPILCAVCVMLKVFFVKVEIAATYPLLFLEFNSEQFVNRWRVV